MNNEYQKKYWNDNTEKYTDAMENDYHKHRLNVIWSLIPRELLSKNKNIFDFGCGNAILFDPFIQSGANITGIDISGDMIESANKYLSSKGHPKDIAFQGDVTYLKEIPSNSLDAILSFNVLAYLTDQEDDLFYNEAKRIVKPGGFLIVTHSNELFDMFSMNERTLQFYNKYFLKTKYKYTAFPTYFSTLCRPLTTYNIRENPLSYKHKLSEFGFKEIRQEFINMHEAPPRYLGENRTYPDTLAISEKDRWKLIFTCSTFGSCSIKEQ